MTVDELNVRVTADIADLRNQMARANAQLSQFGQGAQSASASAMGAFKRLGSGLAALGVAKFVKDCNSAYITQMSNELKLSTVMRQRLGATNAEIQAIKTLASEQQKIGIIGDEVQLAGAQQLATFVTQKSTLETLIPAMNNLMAQQNGYNSTASGAVSIANLFGKALQGQTGALTRVGITFTEAQENVLKYGTEEQRAATLAKVVTDNVGNMNEALRNMPTGELTALANDFGDLQEQIGATFQPLIASVVPMLSQAIYDVQPLVSGLASGFSAIADVLNSLDPTLRQTIFYIAAAAAVIKMLNRAVGTTASGLILLGTLLTWIIGKFTQANAESAEVTEGAFLGAADAADTAKDSTDELTDSLNNAKKAAGGLAGFDEITKLSGSSGDTIASRIATKEDVENINNAVEGAAKLSGMDIEIPEIEVPELDWGGFISGVADVGSLIWTALFGEEDEKYEALKQLNGYVETIFGPEFTEHFQTVGNNMYEAFNSSKDKSLGTFRALNELVKGIFGDEFTSFWNGVGDDIYTAFHGSAEESYDAWYRLNEKLKGIPFWESISPFFQKVGASLQGITSAFGYLINGDMDGVTVALAQAGAAVGLVDQQTAAELSDAYNTKKYGDPVSANIAEDKILKQDQEWSAPIAEFVVTGGKNNEMYQQIQNALSPGTKFANSLADVLTAAGVDIDYDVDYRDSPFYHLGSLAGNGKSAPEAAKEYAIAGGGGKFGLANKYAYIGDIPQSTGSTLADYEAAKGRSKAQADIAPPPASAADMYNIAQAAGQNGGEPISFTAVVQVDGNEVGRASATYDRGQVITSNGLY